MRDVEGSSAAGDDGGTTSGCGNASSRPSRDSKAKSPYSAQSISEKGAKRARFWGANGAVSGGGDDENEGH